MVGSSEIVEVELTVGSVGCCASDPKPRGICGTSPGASGGAALEEGSPSVVGRCSGTKLLSVTGFTVLWSTRLSGV